MSCLKSNNRTRATLLAQTGIHREVWIGVSRNRACGRRRVHDSIEEGRRISGVSRVVPPLAAGTVAEHVGVFGVTHPAHQRKVRRRVDCAVGGREPSRGGTTYTVCRNCSTGEGTLEYDSSCAHSSVSCSRRHSSPRPCISRSWRSRQRLAFARNTSPPKQSTAIRHLPESTRRRPPKRCSGDGWLRRRGCSPRAGSGSCPCHALVATPSP